MNLKGRVEKIAVESRYCPKPNTVSDKEYDRIIRQLMCRLIDVEEMFPGEYDYYEYVKDEYLPDFLKYEKNRRYIYSVEKSRNDVYALVITDYWSTDRRQDTIIKVPLFILEENWYDNIESQRISKRINEIDKEINRIEVIMTSGTGQIMELNKEKKELEIKLRELK